MTIIHQVRELRKCFLGCAMLVACGMSYGQNRVSLNRYKLVDQPLADIVWVADLSGGGELLVAVHLNDVLDADQTMQEIVLQGNSAVIPHKLPGSLPSVRYESGMIETTGKLVFAGENIGLGIPDPPLDFTITKTADSSGTIFSWKNPSISSDQTILMGAGAISERLAGTESSIVRDHIIDTTKGGREYHLQGFRFASETNIGSEVERNINLPQASRPSNVGIAILEESNPLLVSEKADLPFTNGITQNWSRWSLSVDSGIGCRMGDKGHNTQIRTFYQVLQGQGTGFVGGIKRRLLGLSSGQTYRLKLQVSTLMTDPGDWKYTVHAVSLPSGVEELTPEQMAGLAPLPNGTSGETAAQMAAYANNKPSALMLGKTVWKNRFTNEVVDDNTITDITIPEGHDKIAIWLRLSGSGENDQVGFDYLEYELLE